MTGGDPWGIPESQAEIDLRYVMDDYVKQKIRILSFLAMIAVVIIHSNTIGTLPDPSRWNSWFQQAFSRVGTSWAVPFFFVVSGFLYQRVSIAKGYGRLLNSKAKSLLVPYVLWALIGTALSVALIVVNNHITGHALFERTFLARPGVWGKIDALFGITLNGPSGNLALWYVRSLMVLFLFSPLWQLVAKFPAIVLGGVCLVAVLLGGESGITAINLRFTSIGFFLLGVACAKGHWEQIRFPWWVLSLMATLWVPSVVVVSGYGNLLYGLFANIISGAIQVGGICVAYGLYDVVASWGERGRVPSFMARTFWVYCLHGPVGGWFVASSLFLIGKSDVASVSIAIGMPLITILACLFAGWFCERLVPRLYHVLTGMR